MGGQTYNAAKAADYAFKMLVPKLSNEVSTVDLDMVVHGIDLEAIFSNPESVRHGVKDDIKVLVSWQSATGALNLRAQIPAPDNDQTVLEALENPWRSNLRMALSRSIWRIKSPQLQASNMCRHGPRLQSWCLCPATSTISPATSSDP